MDTEIESSGGCDVRFERIIKSYGTFHAVRSLSLAADRGEFFTILGPSGSGKTTTLMMLAGFTAPTAGDIFIDGRAVTKLSPQARQIGMVFQNYALFPHLTIRDNVAFPLRVRGLPAQEISRRVSAILDMVQLGSHMEHFPRQLSGGQQQRVALARALVFQPRLMLLDEPLGALDKKLRAQMQMEIKQIQQRFNFTVVYITHDQEEALTMSDRIAVMNKGRIEQIGSPTELYEKPGNSFVASFLGESNFIEGVVESNEKNACCVRHADGGVFLGVSDAPLSPGQHVQAAIRPERLAIANTPGMRENCWPGAVEEVIYVGDASRVRVRVGNSTTLMAKVQNGFQPFAIRKGERVEVLWRAGDTRLFPMDAERPGDD